MIDPKYTQYAEDVVNGKVVAGKLIILSCQRYLAFLQDDRYEFRPDKVDRVINFIAKLRHFSGKTAGKHFILEAWQVWCVASIFGVYVKATGLRLTNKVFILIARKNGKSAFASALCLYALMADGEAAAQVLNVANNREQGKLLFDMEVNMARTIDPKSKYLKYMRDRIKFDRTKSYSRCLSSDSNGLDGLSASVAVLDETHSYKDSSLWDVLISSMGFREQPLAIQISTAGFNLFGFCKQYRDMCSNILHGLAEDDSQFAAIYEMDEGDDWEDERNWVKSNPNLDVTVTSAYLRDQVRMAKNNTSLQVGVLTKNFNQWVASQDIWIPDEILRTQSINLDLSKQFNGEEVFAFCGVDLASVSDLTAFAVMVPYEGNFYFKLFYYLPQSTLQGNSNSELYKEWKRKGLLTITSGNVTDYDYLLTDMLKTADVIPFSKVAYDSYNATQWAINATQEGLPLEPYSQALWNFNRATKEFERLIKQGRVFIDNNEITRWCFGNVALKWDHNDNCKPVKSGGEQGKIDGVIAMLEALGIYLENSKFNSADISV